MLPEQVSKYGIKVIPLNVHFGDEVYKDDGIDLTAEQFYHKLTTSPNMPRTSQPSAGEFMELYQELAADADEIVSIHISGKLSGTISSAETARGMVDVKVHTIDSLFASQACARLAILAARAAAAGMAGDDIVALVERVREQTMLVFSVDTLEYLQKNGRIGRAQALLGSIMQVKPILKVDPEGYVATYDKVRGKSRVQPRVVAAALERFPEGSKVEISIIHANAADRAAELREAVRVHYDVAESVIAPIGPVIGAHAGPGAVGLIVLPWVEL
jgi:DegV family protein with EDD domain